MKVILAGVVGLAMGLALEAQPGAGVAAPEMVSVPGGAFRMGDIFGDGEENERPVHEVTVRPFLLASHEVTVGQYRAFVAATSYRTSAEHPEGRDGFQAVAARVAARSPGADRMLLRYQVLQELDGAAVWDVEGNRWQAYQPGVYWSSPGFAQTEAHPVVAVSWDDAVRFCNWLSRLQGLAPAYDEVSGALLDETGAPTVSTERVVGYRLPTEAEWEYAAREGGREVRFASGSNRARVDEINFRADAGSYDYLEKAPGYRKGTVPVGSLPPNRLGLHEMSGNVWEWVSDHHGPYTTDAMSNPYVVSPDPVPLQTLRGGRWGGDAAEVRVFSRSGWLHNDRCNNSGFRIARSLPRPK